MNKAIFILIFNKGKKIQKEKQTENSNKNWKILLIFLIVKKQLKKRKEKINFKKELKSVNKWLVEAVRLLCKETSLV